VSTSHPSPDEILVVDDEPANLRLLQQLLGEAGYCVRLAKSGELALQSAKIKPPALILLDIMMPEMDGYEVCRRLKEDQATCSIPVIFLSALESEQDKVKAFEVGGADYVVKPLRRAEVMARINTHLALRRAQIELERRNIGLEAIRETLEERAEERSEELKHTNANLRREIEVNLKTVAALRRSERDYRRIIDTANEGIWMFGPDGKTAFVNARMASMLGYDPKDMIGLPVPAFLHEEDAPDFLRTAEELRNGFSLHLERRLRHKDGHTLYTIVSATPTFDDAQHYQGAFAMFTDITARKRAEAEILLLNRELEERVAQRTAALEAANKEMEAFSYSVSHDLRAPLRAINGFASALEQDCASCLDDEGKRYLSLIRQGASRMARLIDDLLDLSRSSKGELGMRPVDMTGLIQQVYGELRDVVPERNIQLVMGDLPPALCDQSLIRQVLVNLLSNAIKYTSRKSEAVIEVRGRAGQDANTYSIGDNGAGFDMKFASKLFGVFQRLHTYEEFEGNGIGLAIVKRIVERHGGHLWAEGEVGKGAVFYFTLPSVSEGNTCAPSKERDTIPAAARLALSEAV
jgi:PAS domain S-box-containing protein